MSHNSSLGAPDQLRQRWRLRRRQPLARRGKPQASDPDCPISMEKDGALYITSLEMSLMYDHNLVAFCLAEVYAYG